MATDDQVLQDGLLPTDDRPRGILTKDDRKFLRGEKEYEHVESNANARARIRERIINGFLDFALIEAALDDRDRERVFDAFDADRVWEGDASLFADEATQVGVLDDVIAFIYRETQDRHPPFETILEHGVTQGENEPGATYYGRYEVEFDVTEIEPETLNIDSIVERVEAGRVDMLTEAEMAAFIQLLTGSDTFREVDVREEFQRRLEILRERYSGDASIPSGFQMLMNMTEELEE